MLEIQIEELKKKLNQLVMEGINSERVYNLSLEIDKLIVKYYKKIYKTDQ